MLPAAATSTSSPLFDPPQDQLPTLLAALADPDLSLSAVAERFRTTAAALAAWLSLDSSQPHLDTSTSALAGRARLVAISALPAAVRICLRIVQDYKPLPDLAHQAAPLHAYDFQAAAERRRHMHSARLAAWLLYRISNFSAHPFLKPPRAANNNAAEARSTSSKPANPTPAPPAPRAPSLTPTPRTPAPAHHTNPRPTPTPRNTPLPAPSSDFPLPTSDLAAASAFPLPFSSDFPLPTSDFVHAFSSDFRLPTSNLALPRSRTPLSLATNAGAARPP